MIRTYTAVVHQEGHLFVADCPEVGTVSQGTTVEEAVSNLVEATELFLEAFPEDERGRSRSWVTTFEVAVRA